MTSSVLASTGQIAADKTKSHFGEKILAVEICPTDVILKISTDSWKPVHAFLKSEGYDFFVSLAAVDWLKENQMWVVSHLYDSRNRRRISVKTEVPRDGASLESLTDMWPAANWHERECYDLSGVTFSGHPNLRRILCPDDWEGHALRKDYKAPDFYHGIQNNVNLIDLNNRPPLPEIV
ncbi:NADH-quinone oxidoreductase subunit C [bacterium]|nr:NADH-quinone oxidoreductase subunit C [bacterium]